MIRLLLLALLVCGAAHAQGVALQPMPDIAPGVAALPRLAKPDAAGKRINQVLAQADARVRQAARACPVRPGQGWTRRVDVAMRGPSWLALLERDDIACGTAPRRAGLVALSFDLRTGKPPEWKRLLPADIVARAGTLRLADGSVAASIVSPRLAGLLVAAGQDQAVLDAACLDALNDPGIPLVLWPDARGGLGVAAQDLGPQLARCEAPVLLAMPQLREAGVDAGLLAAIDAARTAPK